MPKTLHELMLNLREAAPPPPPPAGGPLGGPGGKGALGGGLPPPPMGGLGGGGGLPPPPMGGLGGGGGLGGDMGGGGGPQPIKIKTINAMNVWEVLKKSAADMDKYDELNVMYDRKKAPERQATKKTSSLMT